ncbi:MAG: serine hydrolase [Bacteroidetes bacterium]|nr:serine hydrolase [Bacteroidota bacterium]MCY4205035.1 serine hydrolase [Bacteroidota bacterium]
MLFRFARYILTLGILILGACQSLRKTDLPESLDSLPVQPFILATNSPNVTDLDALARIDSIILEHIRKRAFPGAAVSVGKGNEVIKVTGYGQHTYRSTQYISAESIFDLASLTKVIATTTAAMLLYERGQLDIDTPVAHYLDEFNTPERETITVRHLLAHSSGLPAWRPLHLEGVTTSKALLDSVFFTPLVSEPGEVSRYSSFGMISLALAIEEITGESFDQWCADNIFHPLGMKFTGFRATGTTDSTVVPTEVDNDFRYRLIQGEVHDENAWILGGTAGHAGLFSTALDLSQYAKMMAQGGVNNGEIFLQSSTIDLFTAVVDTSLGTRALGWDTRSLDGKPSSAGQHFGPRSFGHTGFTGTSLWIDPDSKIWVALLTNRVYPTRERYNRFRGVRGLVADAAYEVFSEPLPKQ